jgi:hypothetical protein
LKIFRGQVKLLMADSSEEKRPRKLSLRDQRLFEHWRKTLTTPSLYSIEETKGHSLKDIPAPDTSNLPQGIAPRNHVTPAPRSKDELVELADTQLTQKQHTGCVSLVNKLFEKSPIIIFMNSELKKVGCSPPIYCAPCPQPVHGGFHPAMGITICQNHIPSARRMESTLAHEMVHAFDQCRFKVDYQNIKHIACGEVPLSFHGLIQVRAVALSRECRFLDELRYHLAARWHGAEDYFGFNRRMQVSRSKPC